jgi:1,4-dihydroxy-2-naphthoate octaprenyltransferase
MTKQKMELLFYFIFTCVLLFFLKKGKQFPFLVVRFHMPVTEMVHIRSEMKKSSFDPPMSAFVTRVSDVM